MKAIQKIKSLFNGKTILVISVLILASVAFCFKLMKKKSISSLTYESSLLCDSAGADTLINSYNKECLPITGSVYMMTGKIWNDGDLPVNKGDLKPQMRISLNGANRILDFKVTEQSDSLVSFFTLKKIGQSAIGVDWKNFSPGSWFTYQVIYAGDVSPGYELMGKF